MQSFSQTNEFKKLEGAHLQSVTYFSNLVRLRFENKYRLDIESTWNVRRKKTEIADNDQDSALINLIEKKVFSVLVEGDLAIVLSFEDKVQLIIHDDIPAFEAVQLYHEDEVIAVV